LVRGQESELSDVIWQRWMQNAERYPERDAIIHWCADVPAKRWRWNELLEESQRAGNYLKSQGVRPGEVCALIVRHDPQFYPLYMGVVAAGALPAVLAYPNARLHPDKFIDGLVGMARRSGLDWILTEESLEPVVGKLATGIHSTVKGVLLPFQSGWGEAPSIEPVSLRSSDPCLLQHSSGTTGLQKAVMLSHEAVLGHVEAYAEALQLSPDDKVVSWLPLYHDMGMIAAFQMPLALGMTLVQLDPFQWVTAPVLLLQAISEERGTITWLPNFAFNLLADRVHEDELEGVQIDTMRLFVNCSEPVRGDSHQRFLERFRNLGVRPEHLSACYAMAETTFAATQTRPGRAPMAVTMDRTKLRNGSVSPATGGSVRECVSSGRPIRGCELKVVDETGADLADGQVGEIAIRSDWMFSGYRNNEEDTKLALRDGWYFSGDYGFTLEDEWFVVGRKKDIIVVAGKNLFPEDIEDAVSGVPGVLPGRVVAFGIDNEEAGTEEVSIAAEAEVQGEAERKSLQLAIQKAGMRIDVTIARVYLVPPRWLIKSSAGKPSRKANRQRILDGELKKG
jgi:acyl-CoA synthetase (AMP-forming)/AMP-acid ligase II